mgnify:CR=1 FL=1
MRVKNVWLFFIMIFTTVVVNAQVYTAKSSGISFFSEAPMENIEAVNKKSSSLLNTKTKQVVFQIPIPAFEFKKDLMKEHFNENYMESEKYPQASFNGKINEEIDFSKNGAYTASATGKLLIHGVEKERTLKGEITIKEGSISLKGDFTVVIADHNIKIPKVVIKNIAEEVLVKVKVEYQPYTKNQ